MIRLANETDAISWDRFVDTHKAKTFAHRWGWSRVFTNSYNAKICYILAEDNSKITGVLPAVIQKSALFGKFMISLPWLDYGGPLAESDEISQGLVDFATEIACVEKCEFIELRAVRRAIPGLIGKSHKFTFILDLTPGEDGVWQLFNGKCRNQIRKAEKTGLEVRFGGIEYFADFYKIFSRNMRDLGTPVWPQGLFREQFHNFSKETELALVFLDSKPIACALLIHYGEYSAVPSASAYREFLKLSPNNIMYWEIIKRCIRRGTTAFDFGRSSLDAGTYHFKKQWVKTPQPQIWQYKLITANEIPSLNPENPKMRIAINLWKKIPVPIANLIGPRIAVKLP